MVDILEIVPATRAHVQFMINNIYPMDADEIKAYGYSVETGINLSFVRADQCWVALAPDGPVCMWGVYKARTLLGSTVGWMITSTLIDKYSRVFLRQAKEHVKEIHNEVGDMENYIWAEHQRALKFYKWLGFKVEDGIFIGPQNIPFHKVCYRREQYGN